MTHSTKDFNLNCYGCDPDEYVETLKQSFLFDFGGAAAMLVSELSDVQEMIMHPGNQEECRKAINRIKFAITHFMTRKNNA